MRCRHGAIQNPEQFKFKFNLSLFHHTIVKGLIDFHIKRTGSVAHREVTELKVMLSKLVLGGLNGTPNVTSRLISV